MSSLALPDLSVLSAARDAVLGGIAGLADALPESPEGITASLTGGTATLSASVSIDADALTGSLAGSLEALVGQLPSGGLDQVQALVDGVSAALAAIEPAREALLSGGSLRDVKALVLDQVGDPTARVAEVVSRLAEALPAEAVEPLQELVEAITGFESSGSTDPVEIGAFLVRGFVGVPADLLDGPRAAVEGFFGGIDALVDAADVTALGTELAGIAADLTAAEAAIVALDVGDVAAHAALAANLGALRDRLLALRTSLLALANGLSTGLAALDLSALTGPLAAALAAVPEIRIPRPNDYVEIVIEPIRSLRVMIEAMSPAQVAQALAGLRAYVQESLAGLGAAQALEQMLAPLGQVGEAISGLGLDDLRDALSDALDGIGDAVGEVTGALDSVRGELVAALDTAGDALGVVSSAGADVQQAMGDIAAAVEAAAGGISLVELRDQGLAVLGGLESSLGQFQATIEGGLAELESLLGQLGEVDLRSAAQVAFDLMDTITEALRSIDLTLLPDAAVQEVKTTLTSALGDIDLSPVRATLDEALDAAPFELLDELTARMEALAGELESFSPGGLLEPLVAPFDEVVGTLVQLDPARLLDPVIDELQSLQTAAGLSPVALLQPLDAPLASAREALEALDPTTLLQPLDEPYGALLELLEKLDIRPFLEELDGLFLEWLQEGLGSLQQLGDAFGGAAGVKALADGSAGTGTGPDPIGFMPGDVLRPVQDLYEKVVGLVDGLPADTLLAAFEEVRSRLVGALDLVSPAGLAAGIDGRLREARAGFDFVSDFALVEELFARYSALRISFDAMDEVSVPAGAQASFELSASLVVELDPEPLLAPVRAALLDLRAAAASLTGALDVGPLAASFGPVAAGLQRLVPDFLREPLTADGIRAQLDELNPGRLADEVNAEFELLLRASTAFGETLVAELPQLAQALAEGATRGLPAVLGEAFETLYGPLREQVEALNPATLAAELETAVYAPIRASLDSLSLAGILEDAGLTAKLAEVTGTLEGVVAELGELRHSLASAWQTAQDNVLAVSPQTVRAELDGAFTAAAGLIASIDLRGIADELREAFSHLADEVDEVLADVIEALQAMVDAIPAGIEGVEVNVSVTTG